MSSPQKRSAYKRVLIKLSGEALMGDQEYGINPAIVDRIGNEILELHTAKIEVAIVVGGGNILRGAGLAAAGIDRVTADQMGMLATVINALAIQDALERKSLFARVEELAKSYLGVCREGRSLCRSVP